MNEDEAKTECRVCGRYGGFTFYGSDGENFSVCWRHYQSELEVELELWENECGTCCTECGTPVHQMVMVNEGLPVLCVVHLALAMRKDSSIAIRVREIVKLAEVKGENVPR
jgi:hypothetical protein